MGTHEFIWVKEADIIESFDPEDDPNVRIAYGSVTKKKRSSRGSQTPASAKLLADAIEEGRWSLEEFELQLNDTCGDLPDEDDEDADEEMNYSYSVLCQSDDEAEAEEATDQTTKATTTGEKANDLSLSDSEELHELLATDGMIDFTLEGRKNAKKRAAALKKQKADAKKETLKKQKEEHAKKVKLNKAKKAQEELLKKKKKEPSSKSKSKSSPRGKTSEQKKRDQKREREEKRDLRELERRRQKREKERERVLQQLEDDPNVKTKKRKGSLDKS
eukprot:scaffold52888_cov30-Attheya_sp.AAC.1